MGTAHAASTSTPSALATIRLAGNVLPGLSRLASVPADPATHLSIGVALARPDARGEDALLTALYDPTSPQFHRFPTVDQVAARFGVPRGRTAAVVDQLQAAGLHVAGVDRTGDYVSAEGTVAQVSRAFGVTERQYTVHGLTFLANTAGPAVPRTAGVTTVVGLNTLQRFSRPSDTRHAKTVQDTCLQGTCTGVTTPQDLWSVYEQPAAYTGAKTRTAVIGEGSTKNLTGYLRKQEAAYGLPKVAVKTICVQGGDCGTATDGDGEWQIDTQAQAGMAPDLAEEDLYFARTILDGDLNNAFVAWAEDPKGPSIASASLGECEAGPANDVFTGPLGPTDGNTSGETYSVLAVGNGEQDAIDPVLKVAAMAGKTLFASTGDTGSSCPLAYLPAVGAGNGVANQVYPAQNYPAVSPWVVAVGGTVLYTDDNGESAGDTYVPGKAPATRSQEYAWTFGGGGASLYTAAPAWQAPVAAISQPCVVGRDGSTTVTGSQCRGVPDVAAQSGDVVTNGYSVYGASGFTSGGGTSLSAPLWAGMWARVQSASDEPVGFASPALYAVGTGAGYAKAFTDITLGGNGLHTAGTGWDYTTGFGAPKVSGLVDALVPAAQRTDRPHTTLAKRAPR